MPSQPPFTVPDADFAEVDKDFRGDDDLLCWAAASCCALWYSQWVNDTMTWIKVEETEDENQEPVTTETTVNFESPTDVFEYTKKYFQDWGGFSYWHMMWMINGSCYGLTTTNDSTFKQEGGGAFYNLTPQDTFKYIYNVPSDSVLPLLNSWRTNYNSDGERCGATVGVQWGTTANTPTTWQDFTGGHEVSLWGFDWTGSDFTNPANLTGIQIADPDDETNDFRFWLQATYDPSVHMYKLVCNDENVSASSPFKNTPSAWLQTVTLIRQKPSDLYHVKNERVVSDE